MGECGKEQRKSEWIGRGGGHEESAPASWPDSGQVQIDL